MQTKITSFFGGLAFGCLVATNATAQDTETLHFGNDDGSYACSSFGATFNMAQRRSCNFESFNAFGELHNDIWQEIDSSGLSAIDKESALHTIRTQCTSRLGDAQEALIFTEENLSSSRYPQNLNRTFRLLQEGAIACLETFKTVAEQTNLPLQSQIREEAELFFDPALVR